MIGERLKSERTRLGLTQPALADIADAAKRTVIDWEKGVSTPTAAQLAALATAGVDVLYVVTGLPTPGNAVRDLVPGKAVRDTGIARGRAVEELRATGALPARSSKAGARAAAQAAPTDLPPDEQLLLDSYRALSTARKKQLLAELLTGATAKKTGKAGGVTVTGNGNRTAGGTYHEK